MGAVQGFNGLPSPAQARETVFNTPLGVTALSQPQPEQLRPFPGASHRAPRRAPKAAGRLPPFRGPDPELLSQFSPVPYPINA